ncbi:hypothetical protein C2W62_30155 [Candidatus Entotheonella serta]|nr:hypothetical protein C2W62_30155 [Candidatus Entotheonella serta]
MPRITLATCQEWPIPIVDEPLRKVLMARGHTVHSTPWNGVQDTFYDADIVVIRACWDYSQSPHEFAEWIGSLEHASVRLHNPPDVIRWNMEKRYLLDLQAQGIHLPETVIIKVAQNEDVLTEIERHGWNEAVAKPLVGQGGLGVMRLHPQHFDSWPQLSSGHQQIVLQEFRPEISTRDETLLVFFAGCFSHAIRRIVAPDEWRSNTRYGARKVKCSVSSEIVRQAQEVLSVLTHTPLYARVDGLIDDNTLTVMELELIEPDLGFAEVPGATETFVRHIEDQL